MQQLRRLRRRRPLPVTARRRQPRPAPTVPAATRALLRRLAARHETPAFVEGDPLQCLRGLRPPGNLETAAFVAASLSYGSRAQFLPKIRCILDAAGGDVHGWVLSGAFRRSFRHGDASCFYRLFSRGLMADFLSALRRLLQRHGTIGGYLRARGAATGPAAVRALCGAFAGKVSPVVPAGDASACKRLCLFLRWMARDGSPVDFGLWSGWFDKSTLLVPLDVHVVRQARRLGLLRSDAATMRAARQLTARLAEVFPGDPCKGDFALYGLGILPPPRNHPRPPRFP